MTNSPQTDPDDWHNAMLVLPRLRVQNANAISSPITWGFPAITAFVGFMVALERRLGADAGIRFLGVGVICHGFDPQVTTEGYTRSFSLTRNPVQHDGSTAGIVEEGRVHLDITLVLRAQITAPHLDDAPRRALAQRVADTVAGMRCAGGSVMPPLPLPGTRPARPMLAREPEDDEEKAKLFRRLSRRWLPGFALVARDDLLRDRRRNSFTFASSASGCSSSTGRAGRLVGTGSGGITLPPAQRMPATVSATRCARARRSASSRCGEVIWASKTSVMSRCTRPSSTMPAVLPSGPTGFRVRLKLRV